MLPRVRQECFTMTGYSRLGLLEVVSICEGF